MTMEVPGFNEEVEGGEVRARNQFAELKKMVGTHPVINSLEKYNNMKKSQSHQLGGFIWAQKGTNEPLLEFLRIYPDNYPDHTSDTTISLDIGSNLAQVPEGEREEVFVLLCDLLDKLEYVTAKDPIKAMLMLLWYSPAPSSL